MARRVRWRFSGRRTLAERLKQRKGILLRDAGITAKTHRRYYTGLNKMLKRITLVNSTLDLDEQICDYIQYCWDKGRSLHLVSDALCGLHHYEPWTKRQIPMSWKLFSTWRKLETPDRAPPLTSTIIYSWMNYAISHGHLIFAALIGLGFFALLRAGELLKVTAEDLLLTENSGIVSLHDTKSGQRANVSEMVHFSDPMTLEILREVKLLLAQQHLTKVPLWQRSAQAFRVHFKKYCIRFHLTKHRFRPYSLRRGGATWMFQSSGSMEVALLKGRWSSAKVAKLYISDALSYLPGMTFSFDAKLMLTRWDPFSPP